MTIGIAGPYSAPTVEERKANSDAMNFAAAILYEKGHIPFIGVNMAIPVVEKVNGNDKYKVMMNISLAVIDKCDALLVIGESPGANKEKDLIISKGLPVYYSIEEIPSVNNSV